MRLAISAVSLSVATMILTIATVKGFQNGIRNKVVQIHGSYIVDHAANVEGAEPLVISSMHLPAFIQKGSNARDLKNMGVARAAISASKACIVKGEDDLDGMIAKGMELGDFNFGMGEFVVKPCREPIVGSWVYISQSLSDRLKLDTGDALTLVFFVNDSSGNGRPRAARPTIAGIFETGIEQIDNQVVYTGLDLVQKYTEVKPGFTQMELWESNTGSLNLMEVSKQLDPGVLRISDSKQFHRQIYDWLAILNTNVWVILILMAVVAIIAMSTILLILMVEKTSFVGIAQAMGSPISQIQKIFLWQSAMIVFFGVVIGDVIAIALCWIQDNYHLLTLNQDVYFVKYVMVDLEPMAVMWVNTGVVLASVLAALLPVQWIKRMTPSRAIRFQ